MWLLFIFCASMQALYNLALQDNSFSFKRRLSDHPETMDWSMYPDHMNLAVSIQFDKTGTQTDAAITRDLQEQTQVPSHRLRQSSRLRSRKETVVQEARGKSRLDSLKQKFPSRSRRRLTALHGYESKKEMNQRHKRFPTVKHRAMISLGNWYNPPCSPIEFNWIESKETSVNPGQDEPLVILQSKVWFQRHTYLSPTRLIGGVAIHITEQQVKSQTHPGIRAYCEDIVEHLLPAVERTGIPNIPLLALFGDSIDTTVFTSTKLLHREAGFSPHLPVFKKHRPAITDSSSYLDTIQQGKCKGTEHAQDIVLLLKSSRHFGTLTTVVKLDIPWDDKKDQAVFRGGLSGIQHDTNSKQLKRDGASVEQVCEAMHRCRLVLNAGPSPLVDARLTSDQLNMLSNVTNISGVEILGNRMGQEEMLQYKAIIMLEGNDVSSGLKWALYSDSVVMAQPFTRASWMMEDFLVPWVHFIPLNKDLTDVAEKMQWVLDNDEEARAIARAGKLWMLDLMYHPDSKRDTEAVYDEIVQRYSQHFTLNTKLRWMDHKRVRFFEEHQADAEMSSQDDFILPESNDPDKEYVVEWIGSVAKVRLVDKEAQPPPRNHPKNKPIVPHPKKSVHQKKLHTEEHKDNTSSLRDDTKPDTQKPDVKPKRTKPIVIKP